MLEVAIGGGAGFVVSFLLFPSRAHAITVDAAADMLDLMADALTKLLGEHARKLDAAERQRIQDGIAAALTSLNVTGADADHERKAHLTAGPDTGPLLRALLRLRHDIVMLGRAAGCELPEEIATRVTPTLRTIEAVGSDFLCANGAALRSRKSPPSFRTVNVAFQSYIEDLGAIRRAGLTRDMKSEAAERFFALGFALEQFREHLLEIHRVVGNWARE